MQNTTRQSPSKFESASSQVNVQMPRRWLLYGLFALAYLLRTPAKLLAEAKRKERVKLEFDKRLFPVDVPERLDFSRVEKDCEQLSRLFHEHSKEMNEFFEAAIKRHDFSAARNIGEKLGLNEQKFAASGGGLIGLVVAVVIIVVVCWPKKAH